MTSGTGDACTNDRSVAPGVAIPRIYRSALGYGIGCGEIPSPQLGYHLFPKTQLLQWCPTSGLSCGMTDVRTGTAETEFSESNTVGEARYIACNMHQYPLSHVWRVAGCLCGAMPLQCMLHCVT